LIKKLSIFVFFGGLTIDLAFKSNYSMEGLNNDKTNRLSCSDSNQIVSRCIGCALSGLLNRTKDLLILFSVF